METSCQRGKNADAEETGHDFRGLSLSCERGAGYAAQAEGLAL